MKESAPRNVPFRFATVRYMDVRLLKYNFTASCVQQASECRRFRFSRLRPVVTRKTRNFSAISMDMTTRFGFYVKNFRAIFSHGFSRTKRAPNARFLPTRRIDNVGQEHRIGTGRTVDHALCVGCPVTSLIRGYALGAESAAIFSAGVAVDFESRIFLPPPVGRNQTTSDVISYPPAWLVSKQTDAAPYH